MPSKDVNFLLPLIRAASGTDGADGTDGAPGANGLNGTSSVPPIWTDHGTPAGEQLHLVGLWSRIVGSYYESLSTAANDFFMWPFAVNRNVTLDELRYRGYSSGGSHLVNFGIYDSLLSAPYPDARLWFQNGVDPDADNTLTVGLDLEVGQLYWAAMHFKDVVAYEKLNDHVMLPVFGVDPNHWAASSGFTMGGPGCYLRGSVAFANMPSTAPTLTIRREGETKNPPVLLGKYSETP